MADRSEVTLSHAAALPSLSDLISWSCGACKEQPAIPPRLPPPHPVPQSPPPPPSQHHIAGFIRAQHPSHRPRSIYCLSSRSADMSWDDGNTTAPKERVDPEVVPGLKCATPGGRRRLTPDPVRAHRMGQHPPAASGEEEEEEEEEEQDEEEEEEGGGGMKDVYISAKLEPFKFHPGSRTSVAALSVDNGKI
ncbi:unnamed protein product [Pleuronectes platessa]|uniref:Uncharacterized protein n=1 Tax=Pleuronectes platessa TaxID=8262 RepID=A0A9N7UBV5_PLEPL|nr:unnamed protein product [Pleuronectes platessa]